MTRYIPSSENSSAAVHMMIETAAVQRAKVR